MARFRCFSPPRKWNLPPRRVPRLPPRRPAALPRPARPPLLAASLRTVVAEASGPSSRFALCRAASQLCRAVPRCSGRSHARRASARPSGRVLLIELPRPSGWLAGLRRLPPARALRACSCGSRCPRITAGGAAAPAALPQAPPPRLQPAAPTAASQRRQEATAGALPQTPLSSGRGPRGEQFASVAQPSPATMGYI